MPRVTYEIYRQRHLQLRRLWHEHEGLFVLVDPNEQWALHEYFLCADRPTKSELRTHFDRLKLEGSSLPHRAGKAYAELGRRLQAGHPVQAIRRGVEGKNGKVLSVRSLTQPSVDVDAYIKTVMQIVDRLAVKDPERLRQMTRR